MGTYLDKRNGRWFVQFRFQGQTYKRYMPKGATRSVAKKIETKMRSDLLFQSHGIAPVNDELFEDFVQSTFLPYCKTNLSPANFDKADRLCIEALLFLKGRTLRSVRPSDIEAFKSYRMELPTMHGRRRKPATVCRELSVLSKLFSLARKNRLCDDNPVSYVDRPKFDNLQDRVLRFEDDDKFFAAFDPNQGQWAKDICIVALYTGLRQNDIMKLTAFNIVGEHIRTVQGKTKRIVTVKMTSMVAEVINRRLKEYDGLLFPSPKTGGLGSMVRRAIAGACKRAGIERLTIRDLRRTCGSRLEYFGVGSGTIAKYMGHSDMRSVHRYQRSTQALDDAADMLEQRPSATPLLRKIKG